MSKIKPNLMTNIMLKIMSKVRDAIISTIISKIIKMTQINFVSRNLLHNTANSCHDVNICILA